MSENRLSLKQRLSLEDSAVGLTETINTNTKRKHFFDRDLSWLSFNERVLKEAQRDVAPLMERIRFLSIYSSNLDEFYRVRISTHGALKELYNDKHEKKLLKEITRKVISQQKLFGNIIEKQILPSLKQNNIHLFYNEAISEKLQEQLSEYFITTVAAYINIIKLSNKDKFFPENNKLYFLVTTSNPQRDKSSFIVNIPSDSLSRFYTLWHKGIQYIIFLDDIIRLCMTRLFTESTVISCCSFKITRDAELDLQDEFTGNLAKKIEKKLQERDLGQATRILYEPGIKKNALELLRDTLILGNANFMQGGRYHNMRDLGSLPVKQADLNYEPWPSIRYKTDIGSSLFNEIKGQDILLHPPYHTYDLVFRFFNEAAIDSSVESIYVTLYRVAQDSRIVNALITAAKNGKEVTVFVELKARFDEANNLKWSRKMKAAGVKIIESIPGLKVHAKLALIKRRNEKKKELFGLIATGNFNESTARYYTDHILMTAHRPILSEAEQLFRVLKKRKKIIPGAPHPSFKHLLVGQFNLQQRFLKMIDREIQNAALGLPAEIIIKLNNLEDKVLIEKLYEASTAGVRISLIVRGICCLKPNVKGLSDHIHVIRIIDRYLEHGRVFYFKNNDADEVYIGSSDWMNRNIYRRIEVCCPVYDSHLKNELINILNLQLQDNCQAVTIDSEGNNNYIIKEKNSNTIRSQKDIGYYLEEKLLNHTAV